jgi:hypothetical protein
MIPLLLIHSLIIKKHFWQFGSSTGHSITALPDQRTYITGISVKLSRAKWQLAT